MNFSELGLAEPLARAVAEAGYERPTPIQAEIIPAMIAGRDVVGIAQTGTGKTAAYVLPLLHMLAQQKGRAKPNTCRALVVVPTRELAAQVNESIRSYGKHLHLKTAIVIGGVKPGPQRKQLAGGCDVVIATPGRLEDHMREQVVRLNAAKFVVLDEADQMFDLGFAPAVRRIMGELPDHRQTALLSATMPAPIRQIARDYLSDPKEVTVERAGQADREDRPARRPRAARAEAGDAGGDAVGRRRGARHRFHPHQARRGPRGQGAERGGRPHRRDPRRPQPRPARPGARGLQGEEVARDGGDRHRRARHRHRRRQPRRELRAAQRAGGLRAPHRPHRARGDVGHRDHAGRHRGAQAASRHREAHQDDAFRPRATSRRTSSCARRRSRAPDPSPRPRGPNGKKLPRKKKREKPTAGGRGAPAKPARAAGGPKPARPADPNRRNTRRPSRGAAAE